MVYNGKYHLEINDDWGFPYFRTPPFADTSGKLATEALPAPPEISLLQAASCGVILVISVSSTVIGAL